MAGPGPRTHRQPEISRWRFWTGAAGRWELLSERGTPPWGKPVTRQEGRAGLGHRASEHRSPCRNTDHKS